MPSVLSKEVVWAEVPDFENYEVSNCGHVRHGDKMLKPLMHANGNYRVSRIRIYKNCKQYKFLIHRLMAYAFNLPKPDDAIEVDHINRDSFDNKLSNLRWTTKIQNSLNKGLSKKNISGFRGVSFNQKDKKWRASISINGKTTCILRSDDPLVCYRAFLIKMIATYGDDCLIEIKNDFKKYCENDNEIINN